MAYEHWIEPDGHTLIPAVGSSSKEGHIDPAARFCCLIHAETWDEAMRLYHEHLGWEPYRPMAAGQG